VSKDVFISKMTAVATPAKIRRRAHGLLDLATRSRWEGRPDYAKVLTDLAIKILADARDIEDRNESEQIGSSVGEWDGTAMPDAA
jgi:hypothetical protein